MHNYHITHKVFLAYTIIGSTPSVLGHLLCLSQHSILPTLHVYHVVSNLLMLDIISMITVLVQLNVYIQAPPNK